MPRIVDYAPAWLSRPSPGTSLFARRSANKPAASHSRSRSDGGGVRNEKPYEGPVKTLARRGNEVFVVVDNQIRWAKLTALKDEWQQGMRRKREVDRDEKTEQDQESSRQEGEEGKDSTDEPGYAYRILNTSVYDPIKQLVLSPNGAFLAIVTPYTVHIALLPDSSHLSSSDTSPIKLKTYQLGPTTHVIPESPVVSVLWHPLGVYDNANGCIVTVTADASVRLWEIDRKNRWSFDRPTLAVDLRKLAEGMSLDEDFSPCGFGQSKGFSADALYMEVASASFGGYGYDEENAWSPMTLWIAMRAGDIYSLCPLLPTKWQVPSLTIPSLTTSIVNKVASVEDSSSDTLADDERAARQQYEWLQELDTQEPMYVPEGSEFAEIRSRPANPSSIPRLQGPFQFNIEEEPDDLDITDIFVVAAKADVEDLASEEDAARIGDYAQGGMSATLICLATSNGVIHIALEMDGVEAQWLPKLGKGTFASPMFDPSELLLVESLETIKEKDRRKDDWPTFTDDAESRYDFVVTSAANVTHVSLAHWTQRLESELQSVDTSGSGFRIKILCDGEIAERQQLIQVSEREVAPADKPEHLATSLLIRDYDLGYLLLTYGSSGVHAVLLESPEYSDYAPLRELSPFESDAASQQQAIVSLQRPPYQVPSIFYSPSPLDSFVEEYVHHGHRHTLKEPMRFSPSSLDLIAEAHRVLSVHTHALERAASDLFRRCERLQGEMRDQLNHLVDIAERISDVSRGTVRGTQRRVQVGMEQALDSRMAAAESRQTELTDRYNRIRSKIASAGGRPMGGKEKEWAGEIEQLSKSIGMLNGEERSDLAHRLNMATSLARDLLSQAKSLSKEATSPEPATPSGKSKSRQAQIPERLQKARVSDAMTLVERESAVIDGITSRLEKLNTSVLGS